VGSVNDAILLSRKIRPCFWGSNLKPADKDNLEITRGRQSPDFRPFRENNDIYAIWPLRKTEYQLGKMDVTAIHKAAIAGGMKTFVQDGFVKVPLREISLAEVAGVAF
jgi:hypothetical protein